MNSHTDRVASEIVAERIRQKEAEGWTPEHDDGHVNGELAVAASCYAQNAAIAATHPNADGICPFEWPWGRASWNPKGQRRDLIRAAALLVAEIERIDRSKE